MSKERELLGREHPHIGESLVVIALREYANAIRAHSGFDPGRQYDELADEIEAILGKENDDDARQMPCL